MPRNHSAAEKPSERLRLPGHVFVRPTDRSQLTRRFSPARVFFEETCAAGTVMEFDQPGNLCIPSHAHDGATTMVVLSGSVIDRIGQRSFDCGPGSFLVRPDLAQHAHNYGASGARCIGTVLRPQWLERNQLARLAEETSWVARGLQADRLRRELEVADAVRPLALEAELLELLTLLVRAPRVRSEYGARWLFRVRDLLHEEVHTRLCLGEIADFAGVHECHLTRTFRSHFGISIAAYSRGIRVRRAARALLASQTPIAQVAVDAGFFDQSHFHRLFRRTFGATPREWRASRRLPWSGAKIRCSEYPRIEGAHERDSAEQATKTRASSEDK